MDSQFLHDISTVFFHGLRAHAENIGDLVGGVTFDDQPENLLFPVGEEVIAADGGFFSSIFQISADNLRSYFGTQKIFSTVYGPDRFEHVRAV